MFYQAAPVNIHHRNMDGWAILNVRSLSDIRESASDPCYLLGFFSICDGFEQSGKDHEMRHQQQRHE